MAWAKELDADCGGGKEGRRVGSPHPWRGRDTYSVDGEATFVASLAPPNQLANRAFLTRVTGEGTSFAR
ncbi:MAG TPA: hypothetical protein VGQ29_15845 [Gemmatimonadales bacterium]|nr:hypothetical protein [Gemmatimonadales bacterium]